MIPSTDIFVVYPDSQNKPDWASIVVADISERVESTIVKLSEDRWERGIVNYIKQGYVTWIYMIYFVHPMFPDDLEETVFVHKNYPDIPIVICFRQGSKNLTDTSLQIIVKDRVMRWIRNTFRSQKVNLRCFHYEKEAYVVYTRASTVTCSPFVQTIKYHIGQMDGTSSVIRFGIRCSYVDCLDNFGIIALSFGSHAQNYQRSKEISQSLVNGLPT